MPVHDINFDSALDSLPAQQSIRFLGCFDLAADYKVGYSLIPEPQSFMFALEFCDGLGMVLMQFGSLSPTERVRSLVEQTLEATDQKTLWAIDADHQDAIE